MIRRPAHIARLAAIPAFLAAAGLALAGCSSSTPAPGDSASSGGAFTYTDALGHDIDLPEVPKTVVAQSSVAAALWDDGYHVAGAYGELTPTDGKLDYQAGDLDLSKLTVIGSTYGEFDIEKFAALQPQLLIDYSFDGAGLWYVPAEQASQVAAIAPGLAVPGNYPDTTTAIQTILDLAGKLGADTSSSEITAAKSDYEAALASVKQTAATSGLKVLFVSGDADSLYVVNPPHLPEATTLADAGLDVQGPKSGDTTQVFAQLSWEQATDYSDVDVVLFDARVYDSLKDTLATIPTLTSLPAVKAGQVYPWYAAAPYSYKSYARIFQQIADELSTAKKVGQ